MYNVCWCIIKSTVHGNEPFKERDGKKANETLSIPEYMPFTLLFFDNCLSHSYYYMQSCQLKRNI